MGTLVVGGLTQLISPSWENRCVLLIPEATFHRQVALVCLANTFPPARQSALGPTCSIPLTL